MKKEGSLKLILAILVIILLCLVSFGGIYVKDRNVMKNILPEYILGMDLDTNTIVKLDVEKDEETTSESTQEEETTSEENDSEENSSDENNSDETESGDTNSEENSTENGESEDSQSTENTSDEKDGQAENVYTLENYKKAKDIIEKRLEQLDVQQYTVRLDENSGSIIIEVPKDINSTILQSAFATGKIEIKINETEELIGDNNSISKVVTEVDDTYANYFGSIVTINLQFTNDAVKKFKDMKNNYVVPTDEEGNEKENTIQIYVDGNNMLSTDGMSETEFLDTVVNGTLPLSLGSYTTDEKELNDALISANCRKVLMENNQLPLSYSAEYANDVHSNISKIGIISVFGVIVTVMFVYLLFRYKLKGLLAELSILGFGALLLLVLRYTKVQISIASIVSLAGMLILQFIYLIKILSNEKITPKVFATKTLEFTKMIIPAFIVSVIIAFANILEISGFGMIIFWGIILFEIFNNIITRAILVNVKNK